MPRSPSCSGRSTPTPWCCRLPGAGRLHCRPDRSSAGLPGGPGRVRSRLAAVCPGAEHRVADRGPGAAGSRRDHAQPGGDGDRRGHLPRAGRAGQGHRCLRLDGGTLPGAGSGPGRGAGRRHRLAGGLLDQRADRGRRAGVHDPVRPGVTRRPGAPARPGRPGPGDAGPRRRRLRTHRGPQPGVDVSGHRRPDGRRPHRPVRPHRLRTAPRRPAAGAAPVSQRAVHLGDPDGALRAVRVRGVPVHDDALPAGRARPVSHGGRALPAPRRRAGHRALAPRRTTGGRPRSPSPARRRRDRAGAGRSRGDVARGPRRWRRWWRRTCSSGLPGHRQPTDHLHGRRRDAYVDGRSGRIAGLGRPADRDHPGRSRSPARSWAWPAPAAGPTSPRARKACGGWWSAWDWASSAWGCSAPAPAHAPARHVPRPSSRTTSRLRRR